jgi:4-hydroxy-2-oxoheptanedioate aldolase
MHGNNSPKTLRQLWDARAPTFGGWCSIPNSFTAEIMAASFDWCCIDMQHGLTGQDALITMLQSIAITGTPAFVRVPWNQPGDIMRALDAGAQGVIIPMVNTVDEAKAAVKACRYPPEGYRSWGPTRKALYNPLLTPEHENRAVVCTIMIETAGALDQLDNILEVPGIDAVFIGPSDLAVSQGIDPSNTGGSPHHADAIDRVLNACQRNGIVAGIFCGGSEQAQRMRAAGFEMLAIQSDARLLRRAAEDAVSALRAQPSSEPDMTKESPGYA